MATHELYFIELNAITQLSYPYSGYSLFKDWNVPDATAVGSHLSQFSNATLSFDGTASSIHLSENINYLAENQSNFTGDHLGVPSSSNLYGTYELVDPLTLSGSYTSQSGPDLTGTMAVGADVTAQYMYHLQGSDGSLVDIYVISSLDNQTPIGVVATAPLTANMTYTVLRDSVDDEAEPYIAFTQLQAPVTADCFTAGARILTAAGPVFVEELRQGDMVLTRDNGPRALRWIGGRIMRPQELRAQPNLVPIRIRRGALAPGSPKRDMLVSPQHRVLVRSAIARRMFGVEEVLVAAVHLLGLAGVERAPDAAQVHYIHLLFDTHEVISADGAWTESLFTGPFALNNMTPKARAEVYDIFPELRISGGSDHCDGARRFLKPGEGRQLAKRHVKNGLTLLN